MKVKQSLTGFGVAAALMVGAASAGTVAVLPATASSSSSVSVSAASSVSPSTISGASTTASAPVAASGGLSAPASTTSVQGNQWSIIGRAIIAGFKKVPGLYTKAVAAVKAGYTKFKAFWTNTVPGWIKTLAGGLSVSTIYDILKGLMGF